VFVPAFAHGRVGSVLADSTRVTGLSPGLRTTTVHLLAGTAIRSGAFGNGTANRSAVGLPATFLGVSLAVADGVVVSTDSHATVSQLAAKTAAYRATEAATLDKYGTWADVKDAVQTVLAWSFMCAMPCMHSSPFKFI
jgi:hypothetical protein